MLLLVVQSRVPWRGVGALLCRVARRAYSPFFFQRKKKGKRDREQEMGRRDDTGRNKKNRASAAHTRGQHENRPREKERQDGTQVHSETFPFPLCPLFFSFCFVCAPCLLLLCRFVPFFFCLHSRRVSPYRRACGRVRTARRMRGVFVEASCSARWRAPLAIGQEKKRTNGGRAMISTLVNLFFLFFWCLFSPSMRKRIYLHARTRRCIALCSFSFFFSCTDKKERQKQQRE